MLGFAFALLTAFFRSLQDVFSKTGLKKMDEYVVAWALRFSAAIFIFPLVLFTGIPEIGERFWEALIVSGVINIFTTILYLKAIKSSDLSLVIPMVSFTPLFLLVTSPLILNEFPPALGLVGVFFIVAGSYMLNIKERKHGLLAPFKALLKQRGPRLMLAVAFLWSISSTFDKIGLQNSAPIFWVFAASLFIAVLLFPIMLLKSPKNLSQISKHANVLLPIGLVSAISLAFQMTAISLTLLVFVSAIKRTSTVMSVLFGHFLFKEKGLRERLAAALIMILGVVLIAFA